MSYLIGEAMSSAAITGLWGGIHDGVNDGLLQAYAFNRYRYQMRPTDSHS